MKSAYQIKNRVWSKQVMDLSPLHTYTHGYGLSTVLAKHIGHGFGIFFVYYKKGASEVWFPQAELDRIGDYYFRRRSKAAKLHRQWLAVAKRVEKEARRIWASDLTKLSNPGLLRELEKVVAPFQEAWALAGFVESYDNTSHQIIEQELKRAGIKISNDELNTLLQPLRPSYLQEEHRSRLLLPARKYLDRFFLRIVFDFFALAGEWRDERKRMHQLGSTAIEKITREVVRRARVPFNLVHYLTIADFRHGFSNLSKLIPELRRRERESLLVIEDSGRLAWYFGSAASKLRNRLEAIHHKHKGEHLSGQTACPGKAIGRVRIVKSVNDLAKFKAGDILVASMTRVEFMPAVRKAAAIVTDEGGVTSHAAIVSRELGIPCIIGTKVATKVLRNGYKVKVNADKGIVTYD